MSRLAGTDYLRFIWKCNSGNFLSRLRPIALHGFLFLVGLSAKRWKERAAFYPLEPFEYARLRRIATLDASPILVLRLRIAVVTLLVPLCCLGKSP